MWVKQYNFVTINLCDNLVREVIIPIFQMRKLKIKASEYAQERGLDQCLAQVPYRLKQSVPNISFKDSHRESSPGGLCPESTRA